MKKGMSLLLIFFVLFYLCNLQLLSSQENEQRLVDEGKKMFNEGKFYEAIEILNSVLNLRPSDKQKIETHLYLGICWIALNSMDKAKRDFLEIVKINPEYRLNVEIEKLPPEINTIFNDVKDKYPIVYNLSAVSDMFYPYRNEKPAIKFSLSSPDCLNLSVGNFHQQVVQQKKCFELPGTNIFAWDWKDELIISNIYDLKLIPEKNKNEYSYSRKLDLRTELPKGLVYRNDTFQLQGREFLPESVQKKSYPDLITFTGIAGLFGFGAYLFFSGKIDEKRNTDGYYQTKNEKSNNIVYGIVLGVLSLASLIIAFKPKKKNVVAPENIKKNQELKREIEAKKELVKVKQEIKD